MSTRRQFIVSSAVAGMATMAGLKPQVSSAIEQLSKAERSLRILFLGGTGFLGPHTVNHAIARGHQVTLFNRGSSREGLFPSLQAIIGNRDPRIDKGLEGLKGKQWDCVIDTSGYTPRIVDASSKLLAEQCDQYLFISSISVYADFTTLGLDEKSPVGTLKDSSIETINGETYGPLKAYSEQAAENNFKSRTTVIRPGLIVGPRDRSDRYTYWPVRIAKGGEVLAPGDGEDYVQYIDVRDLGAFIIHCLEQKAMGIFNATSAMSDETTLQMLNYCRDGTGSDASFSWVETDFLEDQGIHPWTDMPVWVPRRGKLAGLSQINTEKALKHGLLSRPRKVTVEDTFNWFGSLPPARRNTLRAGISQKKESEILNAWHHLK